MTFPLDIVFYGFVYCTTNLITGEKYIGQHSGKESDSYLGTGVRVGRAIKKYGKHNFVREILQNCIDKEDLNDSEDYWIDYFNADKSPLFYNIAKYSRSPNRGIPMSEEAKKHLSNVNKGKGLGLKMNLNEHQLKKISDAHKGKKMPEHVRNILVSINTGKVLSKEHKDKISKSHKGKSLPEEQRKKISIAHKGKKLSKEIKDKLSEATKKQWTDEFREYMSKIRTGTKQSPETIIKKSLSLMGHKMPDSTRNAIIKSRKGVKSSEETKQKISQSRTGKMVSNLNHKSVPVVQLDEDLNLINTYLSSMDAVRLLNIKSHNTITSAIKRNGNGYGFKWMYLEDYNKLNNKI